MAGKITSDDLIAALTSYQAAHAEAKIEKISDDVYMITEGGNQIGVELKDGALSCPRSQAAKEALIGYIMDSRDGSPKTPVNGRSQADKAIMPTNGRKPGNGAIMKPGVELTQEDFLTFICPNANAKEAYMAVRICKERGMDPLPGGDVHFVKYGDAPMTTIASKSFFQKRAEAHPQFDGYRAGIILRLKDGTIEERVGSFYMDEELVGGWAEVYRKDRKEPFIQKMKRKSFDTGKALWAKMPEIMIRKVALVNAEREAFPGELEGIYDSSEMGQAIDADFEEMGAA